MLLPSRDDVHPEDRLHHETSVDVPEDGSADDVVGSSQRPPTKIYWNFSCADEPRPASPKPGVKATTR
eukprot:5088794-Pyramimonas_sp.AAC.1